MRVMSNSSLILSISGPHLAFYPCSMRRSSVYGAGRPSVVTPQHNPSFLPSQTKDLRPLKDPLFKKACQESIFLSTLR